jgi:hypothetical protein
VFVSHVQEAALTRLHYQQCGYDSIQWAPVELRHNRIWNPERDLRYPFISEDLWNKHLGSKRQGGVHCQAATMPKSKSRKAVEMTQIKEDRNEGDEACVRLANMHATKLDNNEVLDALLAKAEALVNK